MPVNIKISKQQIFILKYSIYYVSTYACGMHKTLTNGFTLNYNKLDTGPHITQDTDKAHADKII